MGRTKGSRGSFVGWKQKKALTLYKLGYTLRPIASILNLSPTTVGNFLKENVKDYNPNGIKFLSTIECNDKHLVDSWNERIVDDWLSTSSIKHEVHKKIKGSLKKCDWYLPDYDLYIELFGMVKKNDTKHQEKIKFYEENRLRMLSLFMSDMKKNKFGQLIKVKMQEKYSKPLGKKGTLFDFTI